MKPPNHGCRVLVTLTGPGFRDMWFTGHMAYRQASPTGLVLRVSDSTGHWLLDIRNTDRIEIIR